jgi:hypothetical protein
MLLSNNEVLSLNDQILCINLGAWCVMHRSSETAAFRHVLPKYEVSLFLVKPHCVSLFACFDWWNELCCASMG